MKNSAVLRQAKDVIRTDGWIQGVSGMRVTGPVCLLGAIGRVLDLDTGEEKYIRMDQVTTTSAARALGNCIAQKTNGWYTGGDGIWKYNDLRISSQEEALAILNDCANREEEAGR